MMFLKFFLILLVTGFLFTRVYPLMMMPAMGLTMLVSKRADETSFQQWMLFPMGLMFLYNLYVVCLWASFVAWFARVSSAQPEVTQHWLYYLVGFFGFMSPLTYMSSSDRGSTGSSIHTLLASLAFIAFCIWPSTAGWLYGWLGGWIGR